MDLGLQGKVVLITGGSRGIGRATAIAFAQEGANLLLCARGKEGLEAAAQECVQQGAPHVDVATVTVDIAASGSAESLVGAARQRFGRLDVLVNNAGEATRTLDAIPDGSVWQEHFEQYFLSVARLIRAAIPLLAENEAGRIVNVSSTTARAPSEGSAARSTMKAALMNLTKSLANKLAAQGIAVNTVSPGLIFTERLRTPGSVGEVISARYGLPVDDALRVYAREHVPIGRLVTTSEVANVIVFLGSNRASGITGADFVVDGGSQRSI